MRVHRAATAGETSPGAWPKLWRRPELGMPLRHGFERRCAVGSQAIKPTFHHLCRLSYELKIPLLMLFKGVPAEWRGPEQISHRFAPRKRRAQSAAGGPQLREILAICLTEDPPPSVAEVARRLNFRRAQTLWARERQLCRQIAARHRDSPTIGYAAKHVYKRSERRRLESVLRRHLASKNTLSLNEIASLLGYKSASSIRSRFPEICRAITAKRNQQLIEKKEGHKACDRKRSHRKPAPQSHANRSAIWLHVRKYAYRHLSGYLCFT
jgi:hypothetical protein